MRSLLFLLLASSLLTSISAARAQDSTVIVLVAADANTIESLVEQVRGNLRSAYLRVESTAQPDGAHIAIRTSSVPSILRVKVERTAFELSQSALLEETPGVAFDLPSHNPQTVSLLTGVILYTAGRCAEAQPLFDAALSDRAMASRAGHVIAFMRGVCVLHKGDSYADAAEQFAAALNAEHDSALLTGAFVNLAWVYLQLGRHDEAFALLGRYVEVSQGDGVDRSARAYAQRAQFYTLVSNYDAGIADLNAALSCAPNNAALLTLRGQMHLALYEWDRALADLNAALRVDRTYAEAWFQRGLLRYSVLQTGQALYAAALADFRCYLALAPDGPYAAQAAHYAALIEAEQSDYTDEQCLPCALLCGTKTPTD